MGLDGKVALVTGAGRGIGRAIASTLAREGARVVVNYPDDAAEAGGVVAEIRDAGGEAVAVRADVAVDAARRAMFDETIGRFGRLDVLVNNAAFDPGRRDVLEVDEELFDRVLAVNLKGAFFCAREAARLMILAGRGGRIVNVSSIHGQANMPGHAPYSLSKGGLNALTRQLAIDLAPHRITVNAVAPGFIEVERTMRNFPNYSRETIAARIPVGRVGLPGDVAALVAFLASEASGYITGQVIPCDGGKSVRMAFF
jgi:NAD(P)-dependent dehydrogenase (short-subunit alcohol dehydrogenase family)